jgi:hypothetical protein
MKRLLLSLCIVGAVFSGHPSHLLQTQSPLATAKRVVEAHGSVRLPDLLMARSTPGPTGSQSAPTPNTPEGSEPLVPPAPEEANWVVVIRFATVHSEPSVSAPTVRFYSVGTELQLIDHRYGWFEVLDSATSQRGWIYERYYLQAIRGRGQGGATLQALAKPEQKVVNAAKPTSRVRPVRTLGPRPFKKSPVIASAPRSRYETVASILDRALRP